jgi:enamine deaminase RidA (YjgF/YER057c/UK114 family)
MRGQIELRLQELGIELPPSPTPVANYAPFVRAGNLLFISGQLPLAPGMPEEYVGIVGSSISAERARDGARSAAINVLAVLSKALNGDLNRVVRLVKLNGYVNAVSGFGDHPEIVNGASDLFVEVFGDAGRHARAALGAGSLPRNMAVEIDTIFEVA